MGGRVFPALCQRVPRGSPTGRGGPKTICTAKERPIWRKLRGLGLDRPPTVSTAISATALVSGYARPALGYIERQIRLPRGAQLIALLKVSFRQVIMIRRRCGHFVHQVFKDIHRFAAQALAQIDGAQGIRNFRQIGRAVVSRAAPSSELDPGRRRAPPSGMPDCSMKPRCSDPS